MRCLAVLLFLSIVTAGMGQDIRYVITPEPKSDRTDLSVVARWNVKLGEKVEVGLPQDYYGVPDLWKYATDISGEDGTVVSSGKNPQTREVTPSRNGTVTLRYRMSYSPEAMSDASFGPIVSPKHVQTFFCQWMLRVGSQDEERSFDLTLEKVPKGWTTYSTLAPQTRHFTSRASYNRLISAVLGAGDVLTHQFKVGDKPVKLVLDRGIKLQRDVVLKKVESVVRTQRNWFKDNSQPFYLVSISVRPDNVAGTAVGHGFVCFVKDDITEPQLLLLLSHEMFHNWLPGKIYVNHPGEQERWEWEWFDEGFDEYFARRVLLESGAIDDKTFADLLNRDLLNIADDPVRNITYEGVRADFASNRFSTAHKKLSYYRGAVIASIWNERIQARSGGKRSLSDVLRKLYAESQLHEGQIEPDRFYAILAEEGIDAKKDQDRYILRGEPIEPSPNALGAGYRLQTTTFRRFDPGFSVSESLRAGSIIRLERGGPAERAGLREGMKLERVQNSNRFGNAWEIEKSFSVWVEIDGAIKRIDYMPLGEQATVPQYVPSSQTSRLAIRN